MATTPLLIRVSFKSDKEKIGLTNYSDLVIFDKNHSIIAIRLGGYPETVQAMSDAILGGCELELTGSRETISVNSKGRRSFDRKITHDGVYAEAMHCLRDDSLQSLSVGNGDENEKSEKETVKLKRSLYFFCRNDDELFAELDRKLAVPLIPEFKDYFISELKNRGLLSPLRVCCIGRKFEGWHMNVSSEENEIAAVLEDGLKSGRIAIPGADPDTEDVFSDIRSFTQYLKQFSGKIAYRIKKCFPPVYHPGEQPVSDKLREVNQYVANHTGYSLFDAQLGAAEALRQQLERIDNMQTDKVDFSQKETVTIGVINGDGIGEMAESFGCIVEKVSLPYDCSIRESDLAAVEEAIRRVSPAMWLSSRFRA